MAKLVLQDVSTGVGGQASYNANNDAIEAALENTLSRDGTAPNQMLDHLDMNSFDILNVGNITNSNSNRTIYAVKLAASVKNADDTLEKDAYLKDMVLEASTVYELRCILWCETETSTTPDFKFQFVFSNPPLIAKAVGDPIGDTGSVVEDGYPDLTLATNFCALTPTDNQTAFHLYGTIITTLATTLDFWWAQNTSSGQDVTLHVGSFISLTPMATV